MVDLLAEAVPSGGLSELVKILIDADEAKAVSVLADLNLKKTAELLTPIAAELPWLKELPVAAESISRRAAELKWAYVCKAGLLERVGSTGYARRYPKGRIYWSESSGAHAVTGVIARYFDDDKIVSSLGFPTAAEVTAARSPFGTEGTFQKFQEGVVYSSDRGLWVVPANVLDCYWRTNGCGGWLGFPVSDVEAIATVPGYVQRFEGGVICWFHEAAHSPARDIYPVRSEFVRYLDAEYGANNWHPVQGEVGVGPSWYGHSAKAQLFMTSECYFLEVYHSDVYGTCSLNYAVRHFYDLQGGASSPLGLPKSDLVGMRQEFEDGSLYYSSEGSVVAVPASTVAMISEKGVENELGAPIANELVVGKKWSDRIQFFENGVAVLRDGKREILLRV